MDRHERGVSLSPEEQQVLLEIEERLLRSDPPFAARITQEGRKRYFWVTPAVLMVIGTGVMLGSVAVSLPIAIAGALLFAVGLGLALANGTS